MRFEFFGLNTILHSTVFFFNFPEKKIIIVIIKVLIVQLEYNNILQIQFSKGVFQRILGKQRSKN